MLERKHIEAGRPYWCGFPLHLCVGMRCAFHLGTIVGGFAVSTVGAYFPRNSDKMDTIGAGANDFYEMAVAPCSGLDENMNPITGDWEIIERFADSRDAERAHHAKVAALAACDESPWRSMENAPSEGETFLAVVDGVVRKVAWTKTSHVPLWGWCLVDQGVEDRDFCEPSLWMPMPAAPEGKP